MICSLCSPPRERRDDSFRVFDLIPALTRRATLSFSFALTLSFATATVGSAADGKPEPYPYSGPPGEVAKPLPLLLVTGRDHPAHVWRQTTPALARGLSEDPRVDVRVVEDAHFLDSAALTDAHFLDSAALTRYKVVVLHYMNWRAPGPPEPARANLQRFVENGGGLVLIHFACGAWQEWPGFVTLAGRVWDPKLRAHDARGPFHVDIVKPTHPIMAGLTAFDTDDELYTCLVGDVPIETLATATSRVDHKPHPMAFVHQVGRGRVFHSSLGHDVKALGPATLELFRRGVAWTAGLEPVVDRK